MLVFANSFEIVIFRKFFQKIVKNIIQKTSKIKIKKISKFVVNKIFQKSKLFISSVIFHISQTRKIPEASPNCQIISFIDSFVIIFDFSIKNILKLAKIVKNIPKI